MAIEINRLLGLKAEARKAGWLQYVKTPGDDLALLNGCYFDQFAADYVVDFAETFCRMSKGNEFATAGEPIRLLDWQKYDFFMPLFGWMTKDGIRRFREAFIEVAKKQGKSTLCAILELYGLIADGEAGAEVYTAATSREQCEIVYNEVASMVRQSPALADALTVIGSKKLITLDETSFIKALASEASTSEGKNAHFLILDELHAWKDRKFYGAIKYAGIARRQPLIIEITTAGDDENTLWGEKHHYAKAVLSGEVENYRFLAIVCDNPPNADINDPKVWRRANPSMGLVFSEESFKADLEQAKAEGPAALADFKRYRLNMLTSSELLYIPMSDWDACSQERFNEADFAGRDCYSALDLSSVEDMTALVHVFPGVDESGDLVIDVIARHWLPETRLSERGHPNYSLYNRMFKAGWLRTTPGNSIDYDTIFEEIDKDFQTFNVQNLAFDHWAATQTAQNLEKRGVDVVEFIQGMKSFTNPMKRLLKFVKDGKLRTGGNELLRWEAANLVAQTDTNQNVRPVKQPRRGGGEAKKIDGMVALIMAIFLVENADAERSSYEDSAEM